MDKRTQNKIDKETKAVKDGDLYKALHFVGDDPVKSEIEDVLKELLDEATFKKVVAVFNLSTCWKSL